jgi:hypothetical protein
MKKKISDGSNISYCTGPGIHFVPLRLREDFHPATRATSHNAHGHKRRIGHSKKSSIDSDDSPPHKKEKKVDIPKQQAESCVPSLSGASTFFHNQRVGAKGIRSKIKEAESAELLHISHQQFSAFLDLAAVADPNNAFIEQLNTYHRKELHRLAWLLLADHNVLLYGIGNKCPLIKDLVESFLNGEDVIEVGMPSHNTIAPAEQQMVKSLLEHIEKTVLKNRFVDTCALSWPKRAELIAGTHGVPVSASVLPIMFPIKALRRNCSLCKVAVPALSSPSFLSLQRCWTYTTAEAAKPLPSAPACRSPL